MVEVSKNSASTMAENIECKDSKIKSIKKKLSLNIYHYIYQIRQKSPRVLIKLYLKKLGQ